MRLIRGLAALVALAALIGGIPVALVLLGGLPRPDHLSWATVAAALARRDDGTILVGLITLVAWLAWLIFALSLVAEMVRVCSGFRVQITLPGLGGPQRLVGGLLVSVLTMLALPAASYADLGPPAAASAPALPVVIAVAQPAEHLTGGPRTTGDQPAMSAPMSLPAAPGLRTTTHRVQRGDDLWSLAEHYYGSGRDWRRIAAANPHLLTGGPDRLQPGWQLSIPGLDPDKEVPGPSAVTVQPGDSLRRIAGRVYDDPQRWREIFEPTNGRSGTRTKSTLASG